MKYVKAPPYILGLPQWPGTSQAPVSGQAFAEWHADKTITVGADVFAEDVCGDYFPPNGLPLPTYCVQSNGIDVNVNTGIPCNEITSMEIHFIHQTSSSGAICGAYSLLTERLLVSYAYETATYSLQFANAVINLEAGNSMVIGRAYKLSLSIAEVGSESSMTISDLITGEIILHGVATPTSGGYPVATMHLFRRNSKSGTMPIAMKIMYSKINNTEIFLNAGSGEYGLDSSRQGTYPISGTLTDIWQPFNYPNVLNYTSYCKGAAGRYVGSTIGTVADLSIENLGYPANKLFTVGDAIPADTITARNPFSFSDLLGEAYINTGKNAVSKLPFSIDFVYALPGDETYPFIFSANDNNWSIDIYTTGGATILEWIAITGRYYSINVDAMISGRVYRVTLQRDSAILTDMQIVISLIKNDGSDDVDSVFGTLQIHDEVIDEYAWFVSEFADYNMFIGNSSASITADNQLYYLKFKSGDNEIFYMNSEADKRIFGSLGNTMDILFINNIYNQSVWVECPVAYKSVYTGTKEYYISQGGEIYDDLYIARAGAIIPEDVTKAPNPPSFVSQKVFVDVDYSGRTQFPLKVVAGAGVAPAPCYEFETLWTLMGASWPSSITWAKIGTDQADAHVLFFSKAAQFADADSACAFLSARTTDTSPTLAQVEGFLGI